MEKLAHSRAISTLAIVVFVFKSASSTSTFKLPKEALSAVQSSQCPGDYDGKDPWFADPDDCSCYFVCQSSGDAVRMCCHDGLWWDQNTKTCLYMQDFPRNYIEQCTGLGQGTVV